MTYLIVLMRIFGYASGKSTNWELQKLPENHKHIHIIREPKKKSEQIFKQYLKINLFIPKKRTSTHKWKSEKKNKSKPKKTKIISIF